MIRPIAMLVGAFFIGALLWAIATTPLAIEENKLEAFHQEPRALHLASDGPMGHWDTAQLQRGLKVYKEVCAACHGLGQVAFYDFKALGYNEDQVKSIAASWPVQSPSITARRAPSVRMPSRRAPRCSGPRASTYMSRGPA